MKKRCFFYASIFLTLAVIGLSSAQAQTPSPHPIVLHAARLLDIENGKIVAPAEILVQGERIVEVGTTVSHPAGAEIIDLGDRTLLPGMIDAHVHLFLHPGAENTGLDHLPLEGFPGQRRNRQVDGLGLGR